MKHHQTSSTSDRKFGLSPQHCCSSDELRCFPWLAWRRKRELTPDEGWKIVGLAAQLFKCWNEKMKHRSETLQNGSVECWWSDAVINNIYHKSIRLWQIMDTLTLNVTRTSATPWSACVLGAHRSPSFFVRAASSWTWRFTQHLPTRTSPGVRWKMPWKCQYHLSISRFMKIMVKILTMNIDFIIVSRYLEIIVML